jgi:NAD(P)-dependent dehydrogenase (short-subunit alcohol dehydrogenase family)
MTGRLEGRIALITGASRGIGRALAVALAAEGAHLILVARTVGGLEETDDSVKAAGGTATLVPLDLKDFDALDRLGASIHQRWGKLDVLIGNAGILGSLSPLGHIETAEWSKLLDINVTANWRLIRALDPLLRASDAGRAIFLTSSVGHTPRAYWGGYAVSKAALEMLALTYAAECATTAVKVNLVNPGATRTGMRAAAYPGEDPERNPLPETLGPLFVELASPDCTLHGRRIDAWTWHEGG